MAQLLIQSLVHLGAIPPNQEFLKQEADIPAMRALANMQSRGKRLLPFVKEHKQVISMIAAPQDLPTMKVVQQQKRLRTTFSVPFAGTTVPSCSEIPAESRIIRTQVIGVCSGIASAAESVTEGVNNENTTKSTGVCTSQSDAGIHDIIDKSDVKRNIVFGVPWKPEEFVKEAWKVGHPCHLEMFLADELTASIERNIHEKPEVLAKERTATVRKWISWGVELQQQEDKLKSTMAANRKQILHPKRLCLFERILADIGHPDDKLVHDISNGFDLVGEFRLQTPSQRSSDRLTSLRKLCTVGRYEHERPCCV